MLVDYSRRIFGLDIMRAVAILLVVFSHTLWIIPNATEQITGLLGLAGYIGVEIFFVLSGFLIGRIMYKFFMNPEFSFKDVKNFWIRRWFRTLPNYYLILIVNVGIALFIGTQLPSSLWRYFLFLQNFAWEMPRFFTESWSLPIEEFAYIIGPIILYTLFFVKSDVNRSRLFGLVTFLIILVFVITKIIYNQTISVADMNFWNVNIKANTLYRIDAIYYGVFAAYLSLIHPNYWRRYALEFFVVGIILFLGLNASIPLMNISIDTHPFFWNVSYFSINSFSIALALPFLSKIKSAPIIILKPITYISLISYSMYLLHYSVILQLMKFYIPTDNLSQFDLIVYIIVYLTITLIASYLLYRYFEKPLMDIRDKPRFIKWFNSK